MHASTKPGRTVLEAVERGVEAAVKGIEIVGATVGEASLGVCPHNFVRIELGVEGTRGGGAGDGDTSPESARVGPQYWSAAELLSLSLPALARPTGDTIPDLSRESDSC